MKRRDIVVAGASLPWVRGAAAADPLDMRLAGSGVGTRPPITREFFGMHVHSLALHPGEQRVPTPWPGVPFGWLRLWDAGVVWVGVNPKPGEWEFRRMDGFVDIAEAHGTKLLYTFGMTPRWASARPDEPQPYGPGLAAEPAKLSYWTDYVRKVVERYRGRIHAYEVWNEPDLSEIRGPWKDGFFSGSLASLLELTRTARDLIRSIDPKARLVSPAFTNSIPQLSAYLAAGGGKLVDVIGYHLYADSGTQFAGIVRDVKGTMAKHGDGHLPLWNTESSVKTFPDKISYDPSSPEARRPEESSALLAQMLLLAQCGGLERYFYYAWDNGETGLVNSKFRQVPAADALRRVEDWTIGSRPLASGSLPGRGVRCDYDGPGGRSIYVWSEGSGGPQALPLPAGWRAVARQGLFDAQDEAIDATGSLSIVLGHAPVRIRLQRATAA